MTHDYRSEISEIAMQRARQCIARRDQAHPDWCDITIEHRHVEYHEPEAPWPLWKYVAVVSGAIALIIVLGLSAGIGVVPS